MIFGTEDISSPSFRLPHESDKAWLARRGELLHEFATLAVQHNLGCGTEFGEFRLDPFQAIRVKDDLDSRRLAGEAFAVRVDAMNMACLMLQDRSRIGQLTH